MNWQFMTTKAVEKTGKQNVKGVLGLFLGSKGGPRVQGVRLISVDQRRARGPSYYQVGFMSIGLDME